MPWKEGLRFSLNAARPFRIVGAGEGGIRRFLAAVSASSARPDSTAGRFDALEARMDSGAFGPRRSSPFRRRVWIGAVSRSGVGCHHLRAGIRRRVPAAAPRLAPVKGQVAGDAARPTAWTMSPMASTG